MPRVNPEVLRWARETAGLDLAEAARKIGLRAARGVEAPDRLATLERGGEAPSRALLSRMAKQYRRPLVAFYLSEPPRTGERGEDFRTVHRPAAEDQEALLDAVLRDLRARQGLVRSALEEEDDVEALDFVGRHSIEDGPHALRDGITRVLEFDREAFRSARTIDEAFTYLRSRTEEAGVFVLLVGDLGSHHTAISAETFRGYTVADPIAPFIVINDNDARSAWAFTLLHELCHLLLGTTGVSGGYAELHIERLCDDVASGILLDDEELGELMEQSTVDEPIVTPETVSDFARTRNVSRTMVAYRLLRSGLIEPPRWTELREHFRDQWLTHKEDVRARRREQDGGPSYYVVRRHRVGGHLLSTVTYLTRTGSMTTVKAGRVLGVKPKNVARLLERGPTPVGA